MNYLVRLSVPASVMDGGRGVETFVTIFKADNCSLFSGCRWVWGRSAHMHTASLLVTTNTLERETNLHKVESFTITEKASTTYFLLLVESTY